MLRHWEGRFRGFRSVATFLPDLVTGLYAQAEALAVTATNSAPTETHR